MLQILQDLKNGSVELADVPQPQCGPDQVLIKTSRSLVSLGTEKMLLQFGRASWIGKAKSQPEKVKQVLNKIKTDGLKPTLDAVRNKLDQPMPLGYCNAGVVVATGRNVRLFSVGQRVISNGPHAEFVCVPELLCAAVPDGVSDEAAAFSVISAIGLQGVRLAHPTLGETFVVIGLGLIGLLTVQLLRAHGCEVIGFDLDPRKVQLAEKFGARAFVMNENMDAVAQVLRLTGDIGADGVLITAATDSNGPIENAAKMARQKGRVVLVGVAGLKLSRDEFFKKEISFQVSCSYGPGRYDYNYEQRGFDYPIGFVRWTEQRNFQAVLAMMARGSLTPVELISERVPFRDAPALYASITERRDVLGLVLEYSDASTVVTQAPGLPTVRSLRPVNTAARLRVGVIGAGGFAHSTLLPAFKASGAELHSIVSKQGVSAAHLAKKFSFANAGTDVGLVIGNPQVNAVVISTPHNTHADLVCRALAAGQHVFVEKPLALTHAELDRIQSQFHRMPNPPILTVGFNRRFSSLTQRLKAALPPAPLAMIMTVNAGAVPRDHWTQDLERGGGRLIGEGCHFLDLLRYFAGSPIVAGHTRYASGQCQDTFTTTLEFANGSLGTIHYFASGSKDFPKENLKIFSGGRIFELDNFRRLKSYGPGLSINKSLWFQDKGHAAGVTAFAAAVLGQGPSPIDVNEIFEVSHWTLIVAGQGPSDVELVVPAEKF